MARDSSLDRPREQAARWFARLQNVPDDDYAERGRFERWLAGSPANAAAYQSITQLWDELGDTGGLSALAAAAAADTQAREQRRRLLRRSALGIFAGVAAGATGWRLWQQPEPWQAAWSTGPGQRQTHALPDGSQVTLAGGTRLDVRFGGPERSVLLHAGMAAFEVASDASRPFIVSSANTTTTVLGTHFGVNRLDDRVRVSVLEGRVRVARRQPRLWGLLQHDEQSWVLGAGHVLDVFAADGQLQRRPAADEMAWREGALVFTNAGLAEVATALSRYSLLPVRTPADARLAGVRIAAVAQTDDIDGFLAALPRIAPVNVERQDGAIWLRPTGR